MSEEVQRQEEPKGIFTLFYSWMKNPKIFAPFKFIWLGTFLTAILLLRFIDAFLILILGFVSREVYLLMINPEYEGHWLLEA